MTSPQTLLKAWNLHPKKQLGQNFLSDPNMAGAIVKKAGITADDVVLEIGAGLGSLTRPLAKKARKVIAVESRLSLQVKNAPSSSWAMSPTTYRPRSW